MAANLKKRHNTFYAVLNVPRSLRSQVGRNELVMTLATADAREAAARKWTALKAMQTKLEALVSNSPEAIALAEAVNWRDTLRAEHGHRDAYAPRTVPASTEERAMDALRARAEELQDNVGPMTARRFYGAATGSAVFLKPLVEAFIADQDHVVHQTRDMYRKTIADLLAHAGENATVAEVSRRAAAEYITLLKGKYAKSSLQSKVSALSCFWTWLMQKGHIENNPLLNPWKEQGIAKKSKRATESPRRPWTESELLLILSPEFGQSCKSAVYREAFPALVRLALMTGARIEDVCNWRADMVRKDEAGLWIHNETGKSQAAKRRVPVHPAIVPLVTRLAAAADKEGYLLRDLKRVGKDRKRAKMIDKQFSDHKRRLIKDDRVCFHTLRNTFTEYMEGAGVPAMTVKKIIGHERGDLTFGGYSKGERLDLQAAIKKLRYPAAVMKAL